MSKRAASDQHEIVDLIYGDREESYDAPKITRARRPRSSRKPLALGLVAVVVLVGGAVATSTVLGKKHDEQAAADRAACTQFAKIDDATVTTVAPKIDAIAATVRAALDDGMSESLHEDIRLVAAAYDDIVIRMRTKPVDELAVVSAREAAKTRLAEATTACTAMLAVAE